MRHMERWETMDMRRVEGIEGVDLRCGSRIVGVRVGMKFLKLELEFKAYTPLNMRVLMPHF